MAMKTENLKYFLDIFAIIVAAIALIISIRSCQISGYSFNLNETDFHSSRTLMLTADFSNQEEKIIFKPVSNEIKLVNLSVYDPDSILKNGVEFHQEFAFETSPHGHWILLEGIKKLIINNHLEKDCKNQPGNIMIISRIPIMIESRYIAHNTQFIDMSIYDLKYVFYREGNQEGIDGILRFSTKDSE